MERRVVSGRDDTFVLFVTEDCSIGRMESMYALSPLQNTDPEPVAPSYVSGESLANVPTN
jgi:hypothetical protein